MIETTTNMQYLTFSLGEESYALEIFKIREVLELVKITRVPRMPPYMLGVINLRGSVVPVIDMRLKLDLESVEATQDTSIIILEVKIANDSILLGTFVDSVHEVIDIQADQIEPPPRIGTRIQSDFIKGIGKCNDDFAMILDIDRIFEEIESATLAVTEAEKE